MGENTVKIYIALLRGINIGGKNKIRMEDLKRSLEAIGLMRVQTYIQSGNVLFEACEAEDVLREKLEHRIETDFGFPVNVVLRTASELEQIMRSCPFSKEEIAEAEATAVGESLYVALLLHAPETERLAALNISDCEGDKCKIMGRDIYLLFSNSIRNSKLGNSLNKLKVTVTVRNWNTLSKLHELAKAMEGSI